jgi:hypothetical protein
LPACAGGVRQENNGGLIQLVSSIKDTAAADVSGYTDIVMDVYGDEEVYKLHLRTADL